MPKITFADYEKKKYNKQKKPGWNFALCLFRFQASVFLSSSAALGNFALILISSAFQAYKPFSSLPRSRFLLCVEADFFFA